jgi:hypothetical protein
MCDALAHAPLQKFTQAELAAVLFEYVALARPAASHLILVSRSRSLSLPMGQLALAQTVI